MNRSWYSATFSTTDSTEILQSWDNSSLTCVNFTRYPVYLLCSYPDIIIELKSNFKFTKYEKKTKPKYLDLTSVAFPRLPGITNTVRTV